MRETRVQEAMRAAATRYLKIPFGPFIGPLFTTRGRPLPVFFAVEDLPRMIPAQ